MTATCLLRITLCFNACQGGEGEEDEAEGAVEAAAKQVHEDHILGKRVYWLYLGMSFSFVT